MFRPFFLIMPFFPVFEPGRFSCGHWRPLHFAADAGRTEIVKLLVAQRVKLNELTSAVCLFFQNVFFRKLHNRSLLGRDQPAP